MAWYGMETDTSIGQCGQRKEGEQSMAHRCCRSGKDLGLSLGGSRKLWKRFEQRSDRG